MIKKRTEYGQAVRNQSDIVRLKETIDIEMQIVLTLEDLEESMADKRARKTLIWPLRPFILFWHVHD
jgi:hypothetical protein